MLVNRPAPVPWAPPVCLFYAAVPFQPLPQDLPGLYQGATWASFPCKVMEKGCTEPCPEPGGTETVTPSFIHAGGSQL